MIRSLRRRLTALVLSGLLLILGATVGSINLLNWVNLKTQAEQILDILAENGGRRPGERWEERGEVPEDAPQIPVNDNSFTDESLQGTAQESGTLEALPFLPNQRASLSNSYTIFLDEAGAVEEWFSDRSDLYTEEEITALVRQVQAQGKDSGRVGDQFYRLSQRPQGEQLVVLDQRLEMSAMRRMLQVTLLVGLLAYLILGAGSVWVIRRMTRPVQEAFDKQKQFVWDASHELKTPLAVISANVDVLAGELGENEWLEYIRSEVRRTDKLVQNLLTLARMDRGTQEVRRERFDLSQAVLQVALPFESSVFEAGKTMDLEVAPGVACTGDADMLQQLTVILLSNAVKYSDPGGRITLTLEPRGQHCALSVHNTGPAISPQALPHVFDRFFREDAAHNRDTPGNGLGLSIAQTIVQAHQGKITVESEEGKGTTFTVVIP